jgi:hypothetical protein
MPFEAFGIREQPPERLTLEQTGEKRFRLVKGFRYHVPDTAVVPPNVRDIDVPDSFETDIASVPWGFWWLIASYGSHTRAAIVHDALVGDPVVAVTDRKIADYILLVALEEPSEFDGKHGSYIRHQLTWAAVCLFGTMRSKAKPLLALFLLMVAGFWVALVEAIFGWFPRWSLDGWEWVPAVVLGLVGFLWKFNPFAERKVAGRLWPIGVMGLPTLAPALILAVVTSAAVWLADLVPATVRAIRYGAWERPPFRPTRVPL